MMMLKTHYQERVLVWSLEIFLFLLHQGLGQMMMLTTYYQKRVLIWSLETF